MEDSKKNRTNNVTIEQMKHIVEEVVSELLNLTEPPKVEKARGLISQLSLDRLKNLLPDDQSIIKAAEKVVRKYIENSWRDIKNRLVALSQSAPIKKDERIERSEIEHINYNILPDVSSNPYLYLDYMKSQELEEDRELRKYVEMQLREEKYGDFIDKRKKIKDRIQEIRQEAKILAAKKDFFRQQIKVDKQRFTQKIDIKNLPKMELFNMILKQIQNLNYLELLIDETNLNMQWGGYLGPLKARFAFEVIIDNDNLKFNIYSKKAQHISNFQDMMEKIIKISIDNLEKVQVSSNLIYINIKNAFNIIDDLFALFMLCDEDSIRNITTKINTISTVFDEKFKILELSEVFEKLRLKLAGPQNEEILDKSLRAEFQFKILRLIRELIFFTDTNMRNYIDTVKNEEVIKQIQNKMNLIKEKFNNYIKKYERDILHYLLLMGKYDGISYFNHAFKESEFNPNLLSGLLSAIQTFGYEILKSKTASIKNLQYEGFNIYLFYGEKIVTALITKGQIFGPLYKNLEVITEKFEEKFKNELLKFTGQINVFQPAIKLVEKFF